MAWIELHDTLPDHPKVIDLAELLKLDKDAVVGKLIRLWTWALNSRPDGFIRAGDAPTIVDVMRYRGSKDRLVRTLVTVKFLDPADGGYKIHDWEEHVEMLQDKRERQRKQSAARVQRYRERKAQAEHDTDDSSDDDRCNALHERCVTHDSNASYSPTYLYIDKDIDIDTTTGHCSARAQGRIVELSTVYPQGLSDAQALWREVMGEYAEMEDVRPLTKWLKIMRRDVVKYALELAAMYNADNKTAYAYTILKGWYDRHVTTREEAEAWSWRE